MKQLLLTCLFGLLAVFVFAQEEEELIQGAIIGSCVEPEENLLTVIFDYNKNCEQADPEGNLAGVEELGVHSGINGWATVIAFDNPNVINMKSIGNGIYEWKINTMDYFGTAMADITEVNFLMRSANPNDSWDLGTGRDDTGGGGFDGTEPCNDFRLVIANAPLCSELNQESSLSLLGATTVANSCIDTVNNTVTIDFDLSKNCPEADPNNLLAGVEALGFQSSADAWATSIAWDNENAAQASNNGNDVFSLTIDPMAYYGMDIEDIDEILFVLNNGIAAPDNPWDAAGRDERDGGFGGTEPCSDLSLIVAEMAYCEAPPELITSKAVLSSTGDAKTCVDPELGKVRIGFDLGLNCPEGDPSNQLAGVQELGFQSGANSWVRTVDWDADGALTATNDGNNVFTVVVDVQEYYGVSYEALENIEFVFNNGIANPSDPNSAAGYDDRDGGQFGLPAECSPLKVEISELAHCNLFIPDPNATETSAALLTQEESSCLDANTGLVKIAYDLTQNCPDSDTAGVLLGAPLLGFHSGANNWTNITEWDSDKAKMGVNNGSDLFTVVFDPAEYYGVPLATIENIEFLFNNGVANPDDPWASQGNAPGDGGFGSPPCKNLLLVFSELPACDLSETATSHALLNGNASSCVDKEDGLIRLDFDMNFNCAEADPNGDLLGSPALGFHSGINNWSTIIEWNSEGAVQAPNDGNDLFSITINAMDYYGMPLDSITEINFLYNNGVANPDDAWTLKGEDPRDAEAFGNVNPCGNLLMRMDEAPTCDLTVVSTENLAVKQSFKVYPNPFTNEVTIEFSNPQNERFNLQINDITGKLVKTMRNINTSKVTINRGNLAAGIYFAKLLDAKGNYATTKLVIQD